MFGTSRHSMSLLKIYKHIYKLARHSEASTTSEKCLRLPGTPGLFQKSYKNIYNLDYKLARHSDASTTSEKCSRCLGTPGVC